MTGRTGGAVGMRAAVDPAVVRAARDELANAGPERLEKERTAIEGTLEAVFTAAGADLDLTADAVGKIEGFSGSLTERATKVVELHSRLSAVEDLSAVQARAQAARDEIRDLRDGADPAGTPAGAPMALRVVDPMEAAWSSFRNQVTPYLDTHRGDRGFSGLFAAARASGGMRFELQGIDPRDYVAATIQTTSWPADTIRMPGWTPQISRPVQVVDTVPSSTTDQRAIDYMVQTTRTNAAAETTEDTASPESYIAGTEYSEPIREIATHMVVTEIELEDEPQIRSIITADGRLMVRQRLDGQLMLGNGSAPNIMGMTGTRNSVAPVDYDWSTASGARDDQLNDLKKAKTKLILNGRVMPQLWYMHHEVWDEIALSETTAAGYYLGSPANDFVERIWGLPAVLTDHLTSGASSGDIGAILVDRDYMRLWYRRGLHVEVGLNNDDFTRRRVTVRFAVRCALQVRRPQAVCTLTMP